MVNNHDEVSDELSRILFWSAPVIVNVAPDGTTNVSPAVNVSVVPAVVHVNSPPDFARSIVVGTSKVVSPVIARVPLFSNVVPAPTVNAEPESVSVWPESIVSLPAFDSVSEPTV